MSNKNQLEILPEMTTTDISEAVTNDIEMSIYDYEEKYVKRQNIKGAKFLLRLIISVVGIIIFACLFAITMKVFDINKYAGIGVSVACLLVFIFIYIVPVVKLMKTDYFMINVNEKTAKVAKKHNRELRSRIADKMIDFTSKVEGAGWYDSQLIGKLAIAKNSKNDKKIKEILTQLYTSNIKNTAKDIIVKSSVKSGLYSAISQSNKLDSLLIAGVNLQLIKDLVFLYGFRPSDAQLLKIFSSVLQNSLVAYGLGNVKIGNGVAKTLGDMAKGLPLLGSAISVLVDSSVQGLVNGTLTAVIGYQTIKYLSREYRLQDLLDGIEIGETEGELKNTCEEVEQQLKKVNSKKNKIKTEEIV